MFSSPKKNHSNIPSQLSVEPLEDRVMLSSVEIFAAGQTGFETFDLLIDDQVVQTFPGVGGDIDSRNFERFVFNSDQTVTADQVSIAFTNDFFDSDNGFDNNLFVDRIAIDGVNFQTEAPSTFHTGLVDNNGFTGPGFLQSELLNVEGTVSFAQGSATAGPATGTTGTRIRVDALGETGEEILQLQIDGVPVQDFTFSAAGQEEILLFETDQVVDSSRVRFVFLNDRFDEVTGSDRNVDISQFQVIDLGSNSREIFNLTPENGALTRTNDFLDVANSGTVVSSPPVTTPAPAPAPAPVVTGTPGTRIRVDALGETGEEILQLQIDGVGVQDFTFSNAGQEEILLFETDRVVDSSRVRFVFLNDRFDEATGSDRNVDIRQFQVIDLGSDTREIFNVSPENGALTRTLDFLEVANSGTVASAPPVATPAPAPAPVVTGTPGTRIRVDALGETGEEILQLQIDGVGVQDFTFANAGREEILLFETDRVIDSSRVRFVFLNDQFDEATGSDRNVDISQFQVIDLGSDTREIFNVSPVNGALTRTLDFLDVANSGTVASAPPVA